MDERTPLTRLAFSDDLRVYRFRGMQQTWRQTLRNHLCDRGLQQHDCSLGGHPDGMVSLGIGLEFFSAHLARAGKFAEKLAHCLTVLDGFFGELFFGFHAPRLTQALRFVK